MTRMLGALQRHSKMITEPASWDLIKVRQNINQYESVYESNLIKAYDVGMMKFLHARDFSGQQSLCLLIQLGFI